MSSRVLLPGDARATGPLVWRTVDAAEPAQPPRPTAPDPAAQTAEMERRWEQRLQTARAAGFSEGEAAGRSHAAAEVQPVIERLARAIEELSQMRARLRREAEADMLQLALAIARRVLRREMAVDPEAMHGLVLAALEKLQREDICRVRVHPSHAAQLEAWLRASGGSAVDVVADAAREPGCLVFESNRGNLDASVEAQLGEIERGLADRLRRSS